MAKKLLFLIVTFITLSGTGLRAQALFSESFSTGALPVGWSNDSAGQVSTNLWLFNNPYARIITGAGFDANYAIFDSDESLTNDSIPELASLTTPPIDISTAVTTLFLELDEQFRALAPPTGDAKRRLEYSINNGSSWITLVYDSLDYGYPTPTHSMYNISSIIGTTDTLMVRFTYSGDYDWWWAIDNFEVTSYPNCTSPPSAGTTVSTMSSVCPIDVFTLSLNGADTAIDLTYQWQSSADGIVWTDLANDTLPELDSTQSVATYYHCIVTCSGSPDTSVAVLISMNSGTSCYCVPGGYACAGFTGNITNVSITGTTLNHASGCDELTDVAFTVWPYSSTTSANLNRGVAYDLVVTTDDDNIVSVWIDYDQNGGFEPSEWAQVCTSSTALIPNTVNITIPNSATVGPTRMRVRARLVSNQNDSASSCILFGSGESEDYIIGIEFNVGVKDIALTGTVLYPNPGTGIAQIFFENSISEGNISVFDHTGRLINTKDVENVFSTNLDLSTEANGIYFIRIKTPEGFTTHKYILNK
ncbi:MAG: T9SS type A sorting domain-containing protein [Bacteroidia bacterium]|nr:T9SS type A sorting domain-containing protein [Bacteroidia bacterium]